MIGNQKERHPSIDEALFEHSGRGKASIYDKLVEGVRQMPDQIFHASHMATKQASELPKTPSSINLPLDLSKILQKRETESQHKPVYKANGKSKSNANKAKASNAHPSQKKLKPEASQIKLDHDFTTNLMKQYVHTEMKKTKKVEEKKKPS